MAIAREYRWMSFDDIVSDAAERVKDVTNHEIPPETMGRWASQACREFARRSETVRGTDLRPMVIGQQYYPLPIDLIRIREVAVSIPGYGGELVIPYMREDELMDGYAQTNGTPFAWYLNPDRTQLGIVDIPTSGGFDGFTTAPGNVGGTTLVSSGLSSSNDIYNSLFVRILEGTLAGQQRTISDYDGATHTVTVSSAFSGQVPSGVRFQIHPDSLRINYIRAGNSYHVRPTTPYVVAFAEVPTFDTFPANLGVRPEDYWVGKEVRFTSGALQYERTRIVSSVNSGGNTLLTVLPELFARPASNDQFVITDVPNIPDAFHGALVSFMVHLALARNGTPDPQHLQAFLEATAEARMVDDPIQAQEFEQIRMYGKGEYEIWEEG